MASKKDGRGTSTALKWPYMAGVLLVGGYCSFGAVVEVVANEEVQGDSREELRETLAGLYSESSAEEKEAAVKNLKQSKVAKPEVLRGLIKDQEEDARVQAGAIWYLGEIGDTGSVDLLLACLGKEPAVLGSEAGVALGRIDDPAILKKLLEIYRKEDSNTSSRGADAGNALSGLKQKRFLPEIIELMGDKSVKVRATAAQALGSIGDKQAAEVLCKALDDANDGVVMFAAASLGKIGDRAALGHLRNRLGKAKDEIVRKYLSDAIKTIEAAPGDEKKSSGK